MIKYLPNTVSVVFEEIPDMVTLMIEITQCQNNCEGCHSPWLKQDIGEELTEDKLREIIEKNKGVNCLLFSGEGKDPLTLVKLAKIGKECGLKTGVYSGRETIPYEEALMYTDAFDYIKIGPYVKKWGPLNNECTNQHLYYKNLGLETVLFDGQPFIGWTDITYKFWKRKI